jgi:DNA invertase Pin-like site-specific DNA recombinase
MSRVYSYMRWSTDRQSDGSTEDRQRLAQEAFCRHYGFTLVEEITDPGVTSFRGKNAHEGQLRKVIDRAKAGDIPKDSILLFENIDRMSRMGLSDALDLFLEIRRAGLQIGIADKFQLFKSGPLDMSGLLPVIVEMDRANKESERKSTFSRKGWAKSHVKMEAGVVVTDKVAQWLTIKGEDDDRKFVVVDDIADQIRAMFQLALQYGVAETCRRVNEQFGSAWKVHQLQYLLKNRRLIGEHTITNFDEKAGKNLPSDRVLSGYYPLVIQPNLFAEVQAVVSKRRPFAGRQAASNLNIYRNLVFCAGCGGSVRFMAKGGKEYFICTNSMSHTCIVPGVQSVRGEHLRRLLFRFEHWTSLKSYFMEHSDDLKTLARERDELLALIDKIAVRTKQTEQRVMDEDDQDMQEALMSILAKAKGDDRVARAKLADAEAKLAEMEDAFSIAGFDIGDRVEWMLDDRSEEAALERARINRYLTNIFEKMIINFQAKTLDTVVRDAFQGKVRPLHAGISSPADKRFKTAPVTGTIRISGRSGPKKPHIQPPMFTAEELAELKGVGWEPVTEVIPKKKPAQ